MSGPWTEDASSGSSTCQKGERRGGRRRVGEEEREEEGVWCGARLEPLHELPEAAVDQPADSTHDKRAPEGEGGAAGGDRDVAGEDA